MAFLVVDTSLKIGNDPAQYIEGVYIHSQGQSAMVGGASHDIVALVGPLYVVTPPIVLYIVHHQPLCRDGGHS